MKIKDSPLVSIIVVSYQSERYILDVLESVKRQTYKNIELIITDDGSTDMTVDISKSWLSQNKHRFIKTQLLTVKSNTGIPANCNRGLSAISGKWIKFIGADDILLDDCILDNIKVTNKFPNVSFILSDLIEINAKGNTLDISPKNEGLKYFMRNQKNKQKKLKAYSRWPAFLNTPSFFYKKDLIMDLSKSNTSLRIYEDTYAVFNIIDRDAKIFYLEKPTVKYRIHQNAISRRGDLDIDRKIEEYKIFKSYRRRNLSVLNPIDISVYIEIWIKYKFKGINGHTGITLFRKLSLFYWYLRLQGINVKNLK